MENIKIEEIKIKAFVIEDKEEGLFTIALENKGGPIISASTYEEACKKFEEALDLSCSVQNLMAFKDAVKSLNSSKLFKKKETKIEYVKLQAA